MEKNIAKMIIDKFVAKGVPQARIAEATTVTPASVSIWKVSGVIPAKRQQAVLDLSDKHKVGIKHADFFQTKPVKHEGIVK